jgi:ankyrin repeat protein
MLRENSPQTRERSQGSNNWLQEAAELFGRLETIRQESHRDFELESKRLIAQYSSVRAQRVLAGFIELESKVPGQSTAQWAFVAKSLREHANKRIQLARGLSLHISGKAEPTSDDLRVLAQLADLGDERAAANLEAVREKVIKRSVDDLLKLLRLAGNGERAAADLERARDLVISSSAERWLPARWRAIGAKMDAQSVDQALNQLRETTPHRIRSAFATTIGYLSHLSSDPHDLSIALTTNPEIIQEQDENGMTVLHHAAMMPPRVPELATQILLELLFAAPGVDFSIRDDTQQTALHSAAVYASMTGTSASIFPAFVKSAAENGFDFSAGDAIGRAIIHSAVIHSPNHVKMLLEKVPHIEVDLIAADGATAFFEAVNSLDLDVAHTLLDAGANPMLCGSPERNPLATVDLSVSALSEAMNSNPSARQIWRYMHYQVNLFRRIAIDLGYGLLLDNPNQEILAASITKLEQLKTKMLDIDSVRRKAHQSRPPG